MVGNALHERLLLYVDDGTIVLAPHGNEKALVIDRLTHKLELQGTYILIDIRDRDKKNRKRRRKKKKKAK